jgi:hypothetical protein
MHRIAEKKKRLFANEIDEMKTDRGNNEDEINFIE